MPEQTNSTHDFVLTPEIRKLTRASKATVCRWIATGQLPAYRIGRHYRVERRDLEAFIKRVGGAE
jgi:excisionase family DNA binding protein